MGHKDIREGIKLIEEDGELKRINGVDWNLEMGAITHRKAKEPNPPALLFDKIKDYKR